MAGRRVPVGRGAGGPRAGLSKLNRAVAEKAAESATARAADKAAKKKNRLRAAPLAVPIVGVDGSIVARGTAAGGVTKSRARNVKNSQKRTAKPRRK